MNMNGIMNQHNYQNKIIVVSGPTATFKTKTSIIIAKYIRDKIGLMAAIVNFDSLLFYKELNIGTAKPTEKEREGIVHHLLDVRSIKEPMNAHDFVEQAEEVIKKIQKSKAIPILVGGSGFYLRALINGMYDSPTTPEDIVARSDRLYAKHGIKPFWDLLRRVDEESYHTLHINDHYRIRRAIEHYWNTKVKISQTKKKFNGINGVNGIDVVEARIGNGMDQQTRFGKMIHIHLDVPKSEHDKIIRKRIELMIKDGLEQEVVRLLDSLQNFTGKERPLRSVGYKEMISYLHGEIKSIDECVEKIFFSTRHLAKSQRTWFKKVEGKLLFNPLLEDEVKKIKLLLEENI
ncbi:MAG: tRNA dimethylallyltransferase [Oligoflexia bacterium]|nr:tRNA dimethylallyltransferase [Oligoflexia bacterium]